MAQRDSTLHGQDVCVPETATSQGAPSSQTRSTEEKANQKRREAEQEAGRIQEDARHAAESVGQEAKDTVDSAKRQASQTAEQAKRAMSQQTERAKAEGQAFLNRQKDRAADEVSHFAAAMRQAGEKLHEEGDDAVAGYADEAARKIDGVSHYLRERDTGHLLEDVEHAARRRPEVVFGSLFVAGLGIARFLKASRPSRTSRRRETAEWPADAAPTYPPPARRSETYSAETY